MKNVLTYLILFCMGTAVTAQEWTEMDTLPGGARYGAVGFSLLGKGYVGLGDDGALLNDLWEYSPTANSWTQKASFTGSNRRVSFALSFDSMAVIGAGWTGSSSLYDAYAYDPSTDTWTQVADYPGQAGRNVFDAVAQGKGYVGGGSTSTGSTYKQDFWEYDLSADSWTAKGNLPFGVRGGGISFTIDTLIYMGLGQDGAIDYNDLWCYNPSTDTWTQVADFPGVARLNAAAFTWNGKGIVGGGYRLGVDEKLRDYYAYDPTTNTWNTIDSIPPNRAVACGFSIGDYGYLISGLDTADVVLNDVWKYGVVQDSTPTNNIHTTLEGMFSVYPVPSNGMITINVKGQMEAASFHLYDLSGKEVLEQQIQYSEQAIHLGALPEGAYYYRIASSEGVASGKVILKR